MRTIPTIMRPLEQEMGDFVTEFWLIRQWGRKLSKSLRLTRVEMRQLGGSGHLGERSVKACLAHICYFATIAFEYWTLQLHVGKILAKVVMLKCQCGESSPAGPLRHPHKWEWAQHLLPFVIYTERGEKCSTFTTKGKVFWCRREFCPLQVGKGVSGLWEELHLWLYVSTEPYQGNFYYRMIP